MAPIVVYSLVRERKAYFKEESDSVSLSTAAHTNTNSHSPHDGVNPELVC